MKYGLLLEFYKRLILILLTLLFISCRSTMTPLEVDLNYEYRQYSSSLHNKIANAQKLVLHNSELIQSSDIRNRFLEIPPEDHGEQICAVTTYFLLLKYSRADNLGSFEDFYIREINRGNIVETKSTEIPAGFALVKGGHRLVTEYNFAGQPFLMKRLEGSEALNGFLQTKAIIVYPIQSEKFLA
jgi:hypothetical protein